MKTRILLPLLIAVLFASTSGAQSFSKVNARTLKLAENGDAIPLSTIQIKAPNLSSSYTLTLPVNNGSSGQVLTTNGSGVLSWTTVASGGGSGLVHFTESLNNTGQNSVVPVVSLTPNNASVDVDIAIKPKGLGAIFIDDPEPNSGGNKRGKGAIDFQNSRFNTTEVASGDGSIIIGGDRNTSSAIGSIIVGGSEGIVDGNRSIVIGGVRNQVFGAFSSILGGDGNRIDQDFSTVMGGTFLRLRGFRSIGFNAGNIMQIDSSSTAVFGNTSLWLANNNNTPSELRFFEAQSTGGLFPAVGTNYTAIKAGTQSANITYTLPNAQATAAGQVLTNNGSGILSWAGASGGVTSVSASTPLSITNPTTTPNISITNALADGNTKGVASFSANDFNAIGGNISIDYTNGKNAEADGSTKGFATFLANDFNSISGVISIDYTNGQTAGSFTKGLLSATDWNTFNNKQEELTGGITDRIAIWTSANAIGNSSITENFNDVTTTKNFRLTGSNKSLSFKGNGTGTTEIKAGTQGTTNITYTLPIAQATSSGEVLINDGVGNLSWSAAPPATIVGFTIKDTTVVAGGTTSLLRANGTATHMGIALIVKGEGALTTSINNNSGPTGFTRGINSVDWQIKRSSANQVAQADYSVIGGGQDNRVQRQVGGESHNVIGGGFGNQVASNYNTIAGGRSNISVGGYAAIGGGKSNRTGTYGTIPGGLGMTQEATRSFGWNANNLGETAGITISNSFSNIAVFGNADMWLANTNNTAPALRFYEAQSTAPNFPAAGTNFTAIKAGTQSADITYTLPTALPAANGQLLASTTTGTMSWQESPHAVESIRVLRGEIAANGAINEGSGFTVNHTAGTGVYTINITSSFSDVGTPVASIADGTASFIAVNTLGNGSFNVNTFNNAGVATDIQFTFIVTGPR